MTPDKAKPAKQQEYPMFRCGACLKGTPHEPKIMTDARAIFATEKLVIELTCMTCGTINRNYHFPFETLREAGFIINFQEIQK